MSSVETAEQVIKFCDYAEHVDRLANSSHTSTRHLSSCPLCGYFTTSHVALNEVTVYDGEICVSGRGLFRTTGIIY
jgi:hypothetical protein